MQRRKQPAGHQADAPRPDRVCPSHSARDEAGASVTSPVITSLLPANRGSHFRACSLRNTGTPLDPFLGVDHVWMSAPTFPPHGHYGFSAVSYVFLDSETGINNRDSLGNRNLILPGGLHWTTAGSGIMHEEIPAETGRTVHSLQIFIELAAHQKDMAPDALSLEPHNVPVVQMPGVKVRVPLGVFGQARSPLMPPTPVDVLDISLDDGAKLVLPIFSHHCAFVIPIFGTLLVDGRRFARDDFKLPIFSQQEKQRRITLEAVEGSAKVVFFGGRPVGTQDHGRSS
ncbi:MULTISPECIES: pirin family protein [Serratia]|nr:MULTISPECIES: pirin family protein [Serratia]